MVMINMDDCFKNAAKLDVSHGKDEPGIRHGDDRGEITTVHGYDKNGKLLFLARYDTKGDFRLSLYEGNEEPREREDIYSDDADNFMVSDYQKKRNSQAAKFIGNLKKSPLVQKAIKPKSYQETLKEGVTLNLSEKSRLSFAPDIESLQVKLDDKGRVTMVGKSKDGKQSVSLMHSNGTVEMTIEDGKTARSYNNKVGGKFTWRDLKSSSGTRYFDDKGEAYAKEMAAIMDKFKASFNDKNKQNLQTIVRGGRGD